MPNIFRPPFDKSTHDKWKNAIAEHQQVGHLSSVCDLHFKRDDMIFLDCGKRRKLKTGAIPNIFVART